MREAADVMLRVAVAILIAIAATDAQDISPCSDFDINTGKGTCNGVKIDIGGVLCANGFDKSKCFASLPAGSDGRVESFYFRVNYLTFLTLPH